MLVVVGPIQIVHFHGELHIEITNQIFQMRAQGFKGNSPDIVFDVVRTPRQKTHIKVHHAMLWSTIGNDNIFKRRQPGLETGRIGIGGPWQFRDAG